MYIATYYDNNKNNIFKTPMTVHTRTDDKYKQTKENIQHSQITTPGQAKKSDNMGVEELCHGWSQGWLRKEEGWAKG